MSDSDIELTPESFRIHAREKVSTGDYENHEMHVTLDGSVAGAETLNGDTRKELKARLLSAQRTLQKAVERATANRLAIEDAEDWGVRADDR